MPIHPRRTALVLGFGLALGTLVACEREAEAPATPAGAEAPSSQTLAAALAADDGHDALADVAANAGLTSVFEGVGPYTVLAPPDAALAGGGLPDLTDQANRAAGAALVRAHVLPGTLTRRDILAAIEQGGGDSVQMRTMADGVLTFAREGDAVVVSAEDGARARLTGNESVVSNGVIQPVDALLVRAPAMTGEGAASADEATKG